MPETLSQIETPASAATPASSLAADGLSGAQEAPQAAVGDKRRNARLTREIAITVSGADGLGQPFHETLKTVSISCSGCKFRSKNYVPKGGVVTLEIPPQPLHPATRVARGRVIWVQRPSKYRDLYQISMEFEVPGNIWGIPDPPKSWFAHPDDVKPVPPPLAVPESPSTPIPPTITVSAPTPFAITASAPVPLAVHVAVPAAVAAAPPLALPPGPAMPTPTSGLAASAPQPNVSPGEEVVFGLEDLDGDIEKAIARAMKSVVERVTASAVEDIVQDTIKRAMAAINKARQDGRGSAEDLDARIRQVLEEAVTGQPTTPSRAPRRRRKPAPA